MIIGHKIRTFREKLNISPKELADDLDIDLSTLNRIENNKISTFRPDFLLKIAEIFKISVAELFDQNSNFAIQNNEQGQNINCVNFQQSQVEKIEKLYEQLLSSKDELIRGLQNQIILLSKQI